MEKKSYNQDSRELTDIWDHRSTNHRKWFILTAGFFTCALTIGFPFSVYALYVEWLTEFERSFSETKLIYSYCTGVLLIGGVVSGFAVTIYGPIRCGILGGITAAIGVASSYFATNIRFLVLALGLVSGLGLSICYISASTSVGSHFNGKTKLLALSLTEFGAGVGSMVFPFILEALVEEYGWRGTLLLIGGIMFNLVACASIYKLPTHYSYKHNVKLNTNRDSTNFETHGKNQLKSEPSKKKEFLSKCYKTIRALCLNRTFLLYIISFAVGVLAYASTVIFFIDFLLSNGIFTQDAVLLIYRYVIVADTVCRLLLGILKQMPHVSVLFISFVGSLLGCISMVAVPFVGASYSLNLITAFGFGIGYATINAALPLSVVKFVGQDYYPAGLGLGMTVVGIMQTIARPISGYIIDVTGNYDAVFFSASAALLVSSVLFCTTMLCRHYQNQTKHHYLYVNTEADEQDKGDV